ncbi:MAG: hypothetical protein B7Y93_00420 [Micrococcales bacterium 32-70-13]|nr:MAG: hypothetical protein B7Y93_00420 [Micrococcales bacterium 32-70-13]
MTRRAESVDARVAVVTVVFHSDEVLPGLLDSLPAAVGEPFELAIADNAPVERSTAQRLALKHAAHYIALPANPGYGAAVNTAVARLAPAVQWVVVSNPDVVFREGAISALVRAAESDDAIGATGPAVENADGTIYPSARAIPSLRTGIGHALFASIWSQNPWTTAYRDAHAGAGETRDVGWLSGSCLVVRRSAFDRVGGFDEGYFMYFEDVDLGYRLGQAGYRNVYVPAARAEHVGAHSTQIESSRMVRAHHDSAKRFLGKKYQGWHLWPVRAALSIGLDARAAITIWRLSKSRPATP